MKEHAVITPDEARLIGQVMAGGPQQKALGILQRIFSEGPSYTQGDTHHTTFREGQRSVVDFLKAAVAAVKAEQNE